MVGHRCFDVAIGANNERALLSLMAVESLWRVFLLPLRLDCTKNAMMGAPVCHACADQLRLVSGFLRHPAVMGA